MNLLQRIGIVNTSNPTTSNAMTGIQTPESTPGGDHGFSGMPAHKDPLSRPAQEQDFRALSQFSDATHDRVRLSKNQQRARDAIGKSALLATQWTPDNLIQLLHKTVHVRTNVSQGLVIADFYDAPPKMPVRAAVPSGEQLRYCGILDGSSKDASYFNQSKNLQKWVPSSGLPVYLKVSVSDPGRYFVVNSRGQTANQQSIMWMRGYGTHNERKEIAAKQYDMLCAEDDKIDTEYRQACETCRIVRRRWEIELVQNEFFGRNNRAIFRPGTTPLMVHAAINKGRADTIREADNAFPPGYLGGAPRMFAEKTGKKLTSVDAPKNIRIQTQLEMEPHNKSKDTMDIAGLLDIPDPFTPKQR